jgi:hypothetical protein
MSNIHSATKIGSHKGDTVVTKVILKVILVKEFALL